MDYDEAQQHWLNGMLSQQTMMSLSDNPRQFRESPLSGIFRHAQREWERSRGGDGMLAVMDTPF